MHLLEGYGERLQYSVFEVWATTAETEKMEGWLTWYTEPRELIPIAISLHPSKGSTSVMTRRNKNLRPSSRYVSIPQRVRPQS